MNATASHPLPGQSVWVPTPTLPVGVGVGLKAQHYGAALTETNRPSFVEVHVENYLHAGGPAHRYLEAIRERYAISFHGVGLSLGGSDPPSSSELSARAALMRRYAVTQFSEHLAWSSWNGSYFNDLLPLAYTEESLRRVVGHVQATQEALGAAILIENPATYLRFQSSHIEETQFLTELCQHTGCGLLLDINNVVVCAHNHSFDTHAYLDALPLSVVGEIHLAGHSIRGHSAGDQTYIDSHDGPVQAQTWALYVATLKKTGGKPTLIEWDNHLPTWAELLNEARIANAYLQSHLEGMSHANG
jgi:uncharacterized protein